MIRHIEIRAWRAFDSLTLDLSGGATFLVARNGVGKTSLLMAVQWGLFGDRSPVDATACVRAGHDKASVQLTLNLASGGELNVRRSVRLGKRATSIAEAELNGTGIDFRDAEKLLEQELGAPLDLCARLATIRADWSGQPDLQAHLFDTFGVTNLRATASRARVLHKTAAKEAQSFRDTGKELEADIQVAKAKIAELDSQITGAQTHRQNLLTALAAAQQAQEAAQAWSAYREDVTAWSREVEEVLELAQERGIDAATLTEVDTLSATALGEAEANARTAAERLGEARGLLSAARTAVALLSAQNPNCPTCARPFVGDELAEALASQREAVRTAEAVVDRHTVEVAAAEETILLLRDLRTQIGSLTKPPAPAIEEPAGFIAAAVADAEYELRQHDERVGQLTMSRDSFQTQIEDDEALAAARTAERAAIRREALTLATAEALENSAAKIVEEHITPLSDKVRRHWKLLFGEDGLTVRSDGSIVRVAGDREIPWSGLSGGEQVWARICASIAVLQAATSLPFVWLDEPLEHLDPRNRRVVARALARTAAYRRPEQIIVTTYEHDIVHQLADDIDEVTVAHLTKAVPA